MSADREAAIRRALDLGIQAWRTTPARSHFLEATDALAALLAELAAARKEIKRLHQLVPGSPREVKLREALREMEETAQAWCDRDATLGEDSTEWRLAAESRAGLIRNFARARREEIEG